MSSLATHSSPPGDWADVTPPLNMHTHKHVRMHKTTKTSLAMSLIL